MFFWARVSRTPAGPLNTVLDRMMVSAIAASTAKVTPHRQSCSRIPKASPAMTATMTRRCQARIRGFADRCARLPRRRPMPSACGCSRVSATGVTTGSRER